MDAFPELEPALVDVPATPELGEPEGVPWWYWDPSSWRRNFWKWAEYRVQQAKQKREAATQIGPSTQTIVDNDVDKVDDRIARCRELFERGELFRQGNRIFRVN